jgi:hypothetical protein
MPLQGNPHSTSVLRLRFNRSVPYDPQPTLLATIGNATHDPTTVSLQTMGGNRIRLIVADPKQTQVGAAVHVRVDHLFHVAIYAQPITHTVSVTTDLQVLGSVSDAVMSNHGPVALHTTGGSWSGGSAPGLAVRRGRNTKSVNTSLCRSLNSQS